MDPVRGGVNDRGADGSSMWTTQTPTCRVASNGSASGWGASQAPTSKKNGF